MNMTILIALIFLVLGFTHSALFSGTETAFYRVPRIRIQVEAVSKKRIAGMILWLLNRPTIFIATILIGNNIANYLVSIGGILLFQALFAMQGSLADILATIILTPFLFVLGEMFPKYIALNAPFHFLHKVTPIFYVYVVLFYPVTILLWGFNRLVSIISHQKHEIIQTTLARRELSRGLDEGEYAGVLFSVQRELTRNVFAVASQSISSFMSPSTSFPGLTRETSPERLLQEARDHKMSEFPLFSEWNMDEPVGYIRTFELEFAMHTKKGEDFQLPIRELVTISEEHSPLNALLLFQATGESLAIVENEQHQVLGLISEENLRCLMFSHRPYGSVTVRM